MAPRSYTFSHAVTRRPSAAIVDGLRAVDLGAPDLATFMQHHKDYVAALKSTGAEVLELAELEAFPDSVFVEDAALCLQQAAILMRPGAPSRLDEAQQMRPVLEKIYGSVLAIEGPGTIEGGDILVTEREILVGRSERTGAAGIAELEAQVTPLGYQLREVHTPPGVLHFKTDCSLLDHTTILATARLAASGCFEGYDVIETADGEEACANAIRFNQIVLFPAGFPKTLAKLHAAGYSVVEIGNSEAAKLDGGMSCLSLRFSPQG
ncbi:MAG: dimethylarginine dimethylaminohydrolase [Rhizobiaceae bacterium]|nr:dimethylarginine dimethylaminohydrolase [Rhizobiaceae bacterium]